MSRLNPSIPPASFTDDESREAEQFREAVQPFLSFDSEFLKGYEKEIPDCAMAILEFGRFQGHLRLACATALEFVPREQKKNLTDSYATFDRQMRPIIAFRLKASELSVANPPLPWSGEFTVALNAARSCISYVTQHLHPAVLSSLMDSRCFESLVGQGLKNWRVQMEHDGKEVADLQKTLADGVQEFQEIKAQAARIISEVAIPAEAKVFRSAADAHNRYFWWWLLGAFAALAVVIGITYRLFFSPNWKLEEGATVGDALMHAIPRIVVLGLATGILAWLIKSAGAERHNHIVNMHRARALTTYRILARAAAPADLREAILLRAADAIYSPQPTGYHRNDAEGADSTKFVEIFKAARTRD